MLTQSLIVATAVFILYRLAQVEDRRWWIALTASLAIVLALVSSWLPHIGAELWGEYPTIDRRGSLLFWEDGVHRRALFDFPESLSDPAQRLIGFHLGHMWVNDLLFAATGSVIWMMNLHGLLNFSLNVFCTERLLKTFEHPFESRLILATVFGLQLHVLRDFEVTTIEKSGVYWLPLFWFALRAVSLEGRRLWLPAVIFLLGTWYNLYWGLLMLPIAAIEVLSVWKTPAQKRLWCSVLGCVAPGLLVAWWQSSLMASGLSLGTPEAFQSRAAMDCLQLWPLDWNRLGSWQAMNPIVSCAGVIALVNNRKWTYLVVASICVLLALGPGPDGNTPMGILMANVPGLWRFAKPEIWLYVPILITIVAFPVQKHLSRLALIVWLSAVMTSPFLSKTSAHTPERLSPSWEQKVFSGSAEISSQDQ